MPTKQKITLLADRGANCRGETILASPEGAARMIAQGVAIAAGDTQAARPPAPKPVVDPPRPKRTEADMVLAPDDGGDTGGAAAPAVLGQQSVFEFDGFKREVAQSLLDAGMKTADDVRAFVAAGGDLTKLKFIGEATARELLEAYAQ